MLRAVQVIRLSTHGCGLKDGPEAHLIGSWNQLLVCTLKAGGGMRKLLVLLAVAGLFAGSGGAAEAKGFKARHYSVINARPSVTQWKVAALCNAYNFPKKLKGGGVIGILELGGGWTQADLDTFSQLNGLPKINVQNVSVMGGQNAPGDPADVEVLLDIQAAVAAYYYCTGTMPTVKVFFAPNDSGSFAAVMQSAVANGCDVLSISWGLAENLWDPTEVAQTEAAAQAASQAGLAIFAASGDNSSNDSTSGTTVDCPACCPHIIACGGTRKTTTTETVWGDGNANDGGTGGGYSSIFPVQSFQLNAPPPPQGLGRIVPDVSAAADPATGMMIVYSGQEIQVGGTSGVSPLYSGLFAAFGKKLGFVSPTLWKNPRAFYDITQGSNGAYSAATGADACTGLGAPNGSAISQLFINKVINRAPILAGTGDLFYAVRELPKIINPNIKVTDADNPTLPSATVTIKNVVATEDLLTFTPNPLTMGNIVGSYNSSNGTLTLTSAGATATQSQFQTALRSVCYSNSNAAPNLTPRKIDFQVTDGITPSNVLTSTVTVGFFYVTANYNAGTKTLTLADDGGDNSVSLTLRGNIVTLEGASSTRIGNAASNQRSVTFPYSTDMKVVVNFTAGNDTLNIASFKSSNMAINLGAGNDNAVLTYCTITTLSVDGGPGTDTLQLVGTKVTTKTVTGIP